MPDKILFIPLDGTSPRIEEEIPQAQIDATRAKMLAASNERRGLKGATPIERAAVNWYGYGRWDAPFWFIGPEPGKGKREGENLLDRCNAWESLGAGDLIDCFEHHKAFGLTDWHDGTTRMARPVGDEKFRPPLQSTWRGLIQLLLAFKGDRNDNDMVGSYQRSRWGTTGPAGETCVIEVSALADNRLSGNKHLKQTFQHLRQSRLQLIRARIVEHHPRFVILYGGGKAFLPFWQYLACGSFSKECFTIETIAGLDAGFFCDGKSVFVRAKHPASRHAKSPPSSYWTGVAEEIKSLKDSNTQRR